ncbi:MAG: ABC transporter permease [Chloroflexota bacterium]|nr:ABC transporter permease [Chloroflexota bacterium]
MAAERVVKATGFSLFWRMMWARAYPRIIGALRERDWIFFETVLPLGTTAAFVFIYRAAGAPPEFTGFAVLGGAMTAFWLNVLWSMASQLYWDKDAGNLELYILSPGPLMAILLGMAIGGIFMASVRAVTIIILASLMFSVSYTVSSVPLLILVFFMTKAALYGMGMMFASLFLTSGREVWHLANLFQEPIYLVSGFYFPVNALGFWVATFASVIPLTLGMDAMRQIIFSNQAGLGFLPVELELLILTILAALFLFGARLLLTTLEKIGRREGRLTERRR